MLEANEHLKAAGQVLNLFVDPAIPPDAPFEKVQAQAFALLAPERFALVSDYMRNVEFGETACEWAY
jgi:hypothetical protein